MQKSLVIKILIFLFVVCLLTISGYANSGILPVDLTIEGIDVGSLSHKAAEEKLKNKFSRLNFRYRNISCSFTPEEMGVNLDFTSTLRNIQNKTTLEKMRMNLDETALYLEKNYDMTKLGKTCETLNTLFGKSPKNASLKMEKGQIIAEKEKWGTEVDIDILKKQIYAQPLKNDYIIPIKVVEPQLKTADLESLKPEVLLAQYTTEFVKNANRTANIRLASETIKNTLLAPGEVFSFNSIVGPREDDYGYLSAMIISGGQFVPGLGGGICQVSSTLYNSVLLAGLEIVERHPHSLKINYVPLGRDATVNYGHKDLKFKNNTDGYILIDYKIKGQNLTFYLYTSKDWAEKIKDVEIENKVLKTIQPAEHVIIDEELSIDEKVVVNSGAPGYIVETWRIIKKNEEEIKEYLFKDNYLTQTRIIKKAANG